MNVTSPLTHTDKVAFERNINVNKLTEDYYNIYKIDVSSYFRGLSTIQIYKCLSTGYRFYFPFSISGDGKFYEQLQAFEWYYMKWKWEHEIVKRLIQANNKVLEVGCGNSAFVERLSSENISCTGLELNEYAVKEAQQKRLDVRSETIQQHAASHSNTYDLVCSFQVVEHIADIKSFLEASIEALKPGGKLIISVPNNDSFLGMDYNLLNMPPHHMGLWNEQSLISLQKNFNIKLIHLHFEPIQSYHIDYFNSVASRVKQEYANKISKNFILSTMLGKYKTLLVDSLITVKYPTFKSFTVLADYIKL